MAQGTNWSFFGRGMVLAHIIQSGNDLISEIILIRDLSSLSGKDRNSWIETPSQPGAEKGFVDEIANFHALNWPHWENSPCNSHHSRQAWRTVRS